MEFVSNVYRVGGRDVIQCNIRDITERAESAHAVAASEARYRRLFETARDAILILEENAGKIMDANPFVIDLLGYSLDELIGKELWEIGLFGDKQQSKAAMEQLQENGYIRYEDMPLETKQGKRVEVEFVSNSYMVGDKKVIQCNIRDITVLRGIEDLDRVRGAQLPAALSKDLLNLQGAARIRAREQIGVRGEDVHDLPCAELIGAFRLDQVVDSSAGLRLGRR